MSPSSILVKPFLILISKAWSFVAIIWSQNLSKVAPVYGNPSQIFVECSFLKALFTIYVYQTVILPDMLCCSLCTSSIVLLFICTQKPCFVSVVTIETHSHRWIIRGDVNWFKSSPRNILTTNQLLVQPNKSCGARKDGRQRACLLSIDQWPKQRRAFTNSKSMRYKGTYFLPYCHTLGPFF